ncbi:hypothetical protein PRNP1_005971 [Phytophthora ramorum]
MKQLQKLRKSERIKEIKEVLAIGMVNGKAAAQAAAAAAKTKKVATISTQLDDNAAKMLKTKSLKNEVNVNVKSNGRLLFGRRVARPGGPDSIVSIEFATSDKSVSSSDAQDLVVVTASGVLLRLGELRLAEFEQLLLDKPNGALNVIMRNIRFGRASVGQLKSNARSRMLVHRFHDEECIILGNHGAFLSVWETSLLNQAERSGIEKSSVCDSKAECVDTIAFDTNSKLLVVLSEGKLSWWNWREMTVAFEIEISGITSFAVLNVSSSEEQELGMSSLLAVARLPKNGSSTPSLELSSENLWTQCEGLHIALFACRGGSNQPQTLVAYRTHRGVSVFLMTSDDNTSDASGSDDGENMFDENAVTTIAESLVNVPISSLLHKRALKSFQANIGVGDSRIYELIIKAIIDFSNVIALV